MVERVLLRNKYLAQMLIKMTEHLSENGVKACWHSLGAKVYNHMTLQSVHNCYRILLSLAPTQSTQYHVQSLINALPSGVKQNTHLHIVMRSTMLPALCPLHCMPSYYSA